MLQIGAQGPAVSSLQTELNEAGAHLTVDGDFGPNTRAAVEQFQRDHGLTVDGVAGPETSAALAAAAKKKPAPSHPRPHPKPHPTHTTGGTSPTGSGGSKGGGKGSPAPVEVTLHQLHEIMPDLTTARGDLYIDPLNRAMAEFHITTYLRKAAFLAQIAEESIDLMYFEEIASGWEYDISVNRGLALELGNTQVGDGPRYKGRGPIQLTGKNNYIAAGHALGLDLVDHPTVAAQPDVGFRTAGWFWVSHGLNELADRKDFYDITLRINGGLNGYSTRLQNYDLALRVLG